ncbi:MAG: DUF2845 domain-containing protein [Pseudomonadales bacterium]|nr:DUF2845 domain-containing protein [Pseudomonadales bacterium]
MRIVTIFLLLSLSPPAAALRCGSDLVTEGDHVTEVLDKCGEPDYREKWVEDRLILRRPHPLLPYEQSAGAVVVNLWTYNFGRRQFMRELRFENGRLVHIERLNYGF